MDDLEWEDWIKLTDAQQDAICEREERKFFAMLEAMPLRERIAYERGSALRSIASARRLLADPVLGQMEFMQTMQRKRIADRRLRLVKLRVWRSTGQYPGSG